MTEWHINADEPIALDYNTNFKSDGHIDTLYAPDAFRSSDHDPVIVGLCQAPTLSVSVSTERIAAAEPQVPNCGGDAGRIGAT